MPTYEYACNNVDCNHEMEVFQNMGTPKLTECPECKESTLRRLIGTGNLVFKGDSWVDKQRKKEREDKDLFNRAKVARRLKTSGKIPKDAHLNPKDIDLDKYHGPAKLPADHPEREPGSHKVKGERGLE